MNLKKDLSSKVKAAFAGIEKPLRGEIADPDPIGEGQKVEDIFCGAEWKDCGLSKLLQDEDALWVFNPKAFHYFLPAYLLAVLNHTEQSYRLHFALVGQFAEPENLSVKKEYIRRMNLLSRDQASVIIEVLDYLRGGEWIDSAEDEMEALSAIALRK